MLTWTNRRRIVGPQTAYNTRRGPGIAAKPARRPIKCFLPRIGLGISIDELMAHGGHRWSNGGRRR